MTVILAVAPSWMRSKIHLFAEDYKPSSKDRRGDYRRPLCGAGYIPDDAVFASIEEALGWTARKRTSQDPRPEWAWCRNCIGHALDLDVGRAGRAGRTSRRRVRSHSSQLSPRMPTTRRPRHIRGVDRMVKIIKEVRRPHGCTAELASIAEDLWIGSIVECSCGQRYERQENQRDGMYWAPAPTPSDGWPYEPGGSR